MSDAFIGEIKLVSFNFAPRGWTECDGQILSISQNAALFSLLGTTYGGDGATTFALPDLRGRTPLHRGTQFTQGQAGGERSHALTLAEMPLHTHAVFCNGSTANISSPAGNIWSNGGDNLYSNQTPDASMRSSAIGSAGASLPHENMSPYLVVKFVIALVGLFPSRD